LGEWWHILARACSRPKLFTSWSESDRKRREERGEKSEEKIEKRQERERGN
jgi:hypothetical protein